MATLKDFWGDIAPSAVRSPAAILREQAAFLGAKTRNLIEARVVTDAAFGEIRHRFLLVVPALDHYSYQLFRIEHDANLYPVTVESEPPVRLESERDFINWLQATLSSDHTKKIVGNLLAQVAGEPPSIFAV
jgi:hypothetical protein